MPTGTTRFMNNFATAVGSAAPSFYSTLSVDASFPLSNLGVADRYVVTSVTDAVSKSILVGFPSTVTATHIGVLNLITPGFPHQFMFDWAPLTASFTVASCTSSGTTLTTTGNFVTAGVVAGMMVTGAGVSPGTTVVGSPGATSLTLSQAASGGSGTCSFYAFSGAIVLGASPLSGVTTDPRNAVYEMPVSVPAKWWRITPYAPGSSGYSVGSFFIGNVSADLGIAFSPGSTGAYRRTRVESTTVNGVTVKSETGAPHREFSYRFSAVPQATLGYLLAQAKASPITVLDAYGAFFQADCPEDGLSWSVRWGAPDLYDVGMNLVELP